MLNSITSNGTVNINSDNNITLLGAQVLASNLALNTQNDMLISGIQAIDNVNLDSIFIHTVNLQFLQILL